MSAPNRVGEAARPESGSASPTAVEPMAPSRPAVGSPLHGCLSCDACRAACSVQRSVGRLYPSRLVRMVALGHAERVLRSREIWYCLQCLRCTGACPSAVAPANEVRAWRAEAVRRGFVDLPTLERYEALRRLLQRARARLVAACVLGDQPLRDAAAEWESLASPDDLPSAAPARLDTSAAHRAIDDDLAAGLGVPAALNACMSCRECTTACPVAGDGAIYDPVRLFRTVRLGFAEELLTAPAIWLCLGCGRCTSVCTQGVSGHRLLASLQELAIRRGLVPADVRERLAALDRELYPRFVEAVERLLR